jgi:hypothetical protein
VIELPELKGREWWGQLKGMEDMVNGIENVVLALLDVDLNGQWKGMEDKAPVPGELGAEPWKGGEDG